MKPVIPAAMQSFYDDLHLSPAVIEGNHLRCSGMIGFQLGKSHAPEDPEEPSGEGSSDEPDAT